MPYQKCSPVDQKPVNIFYVWYTELCRRLNSPPASVVKPARPKSQTVLNFVADRLKVEEWNPVINALRHDTSLHVIAIRSQMGKRPFLHDIDTEEKLRQLKRRTGSLWTAFILKSLLKSLSSTVRNTQVLTCLEFDGLPLFAQYLEPLLKALQKNKTLKNLSLARCHVGDEGCRMVCAYLRFAPNIEVLNLSGCSLTEDGAGHIAKLVKFQQINRYCESWHNSLRYSDPSIHVMRGIRRVTINNNPLIGDQGLDLILNELDDDLWIKALDMQKCGITENMSLRIIDLVEYSQSLEIVDLRINEELSEDTLEKIFDILKEKNSSPEYQWCNTTLTSCDSVMYTMSNYTSVRTPSVYKVKSAPVKAITSKIITERPVRRSKTTEDIRKKNQVEKNDIEKRFQDLNNLLQEEIVKRKKTEKINEELRSTLNDIIKFPPQNNLDISKNNGSKILKMFNTVCKTNRVKKKNGFNRGKNFFELNGQTACTILEQLVGKDGDGVDEESLLDYIEEKEDKTEKNNEFLMNGYDMTDSQISLFNFMENLKNNRDHSVKYINRQNTSKYYINKKRVK